MTTAASRFIEAILISWDSFEPYENTAKDGLADVDADAIQTFCDESDEDFSEAETEVLAFIRGKVLQTMDFAAMGDDADWSVEDVITAFTACVYGSDGDQPGQVEVVLETATVGEEYGVEVKIYRWRERDEAGSYESGDATQDREEAVRDGEAHAESEDSEPDLGELLSEIEETGYFEDNDIIPHVLDAATGHSQGYLLLPPDIGQPVGTMWTTNGHLQRDDYITLDATHSQKSYAAAALLAAIREYQNGEE